ncbi:MAG: hypothetical protein BRD50_03890 [Bacteroidetes bacterium SW_11_45_7]|nr:MAG: hypothetical protein BRD50_03890 [Bacteroidetes bacterium SW_11_45_7]
MIRIAKYFLAIVTSFFVLGFLAVVFITYFYDEQIESLLIEEMNKRLEAKVEVDGEIDFGLIQHFPKASLTFHDIRVEGSHGTRPLGKMEELTLLLDIENLLRGDYRISRLRLKNGKLNILKNRAGEGNYIVWESRSAPDNSRSDTNDFRFALDKVQLIQVDVLYEDLATGFAIDTDIEKGELSGQFSKEQFTLTSELHFLNDSMTIAGVTYFPGQDVNLSLSLKVDQTQDATISTIQDGNLSVGGSPFTVAGTVAAHDHFTDLDLKTRGENLSVQDIPRLLPESYSRSLRNYDGKGKLTINSYIKGRVDATTLPNIRVQYNLREAHLTTKQLANPIKNLNVKGQFSMYGKNKAPTTVLKLSRCRATYRGQPFSLTMRVDDLSQPHVKLYANGKLDLAVLHPFLKDRELSQLSGTVKVQDLRFDGSLQNMSRSVQNGTTKGSGLIMLDNVKANYRNQPLQLPKGKLAFDGRNAEIQDLALAIGQSRFSIGGQVNNVINYWKHVANNKSPPSPLRFEGVVKSSFFDVADLLQLFPKTEQTTSTNNSQKLDLQRLFHIQGAFTFLVEELRYRRFKGSDFFGNIDLEPGKIAFQKFNVHTMSGQVGLNANIKFPNKNGITAKANINAEQLAIDSLFYQNNNFGQQTLTHKNLQGQLTSDGQLIMKWYNGNFRMDALQANASVKIENGELIRFEPMIALADHLKMEELEHIRFSTLENTVRIDNKTIHIPEMSIVSNAANLRVNGTHTFANMVDYQFSINLSKIMANKFKIVKAPEDGYARNGKGQLNLFLTMKGPVSNPEIKYDKQSVKEKIARDLQDEKKELQRALRNQSSEEYSPAKEKQQWDVEEEMEYIEWDDEEK